jgi:long-subunit fatty acid transport protein
MRTPILISALASLLASGAIQAGGLDRSGQDTSIILKEGGLFELTSVSVAPTVTGTNANVGPGTAGDTIDVAPDYSMTTFAMRSDINDKIAFALIQDNPYGADVSWTNGGLAGTKGQVKSNATTALLSYNASDAVTVYGGIKNQSISVSATVPAASYALVGNESSATGYVVGAAFEKPEIAMRIALTYHAKINHTMAITETVAGNDIAGSMSFDTPTAYNLDFQTGIAANTLLFGSARMANWTETSVNPPNYALNPLLSYDNDTSAYNIGLGRKLNDQWSVAVTYGWEKASGEDGGPFGPTDGNSNYGLGVTYNADQLSITAAARSVSFGDTDVVTAGTNFASMTDNTGMVTALKLAYKF